MKAAFFHDHKFAKDQMGIFYSPGGLPHTVWERYLSFFDTLFIVGRCNKIIDEETKGYIISSRDNVIFNVIEEYTGIFSFLINYTTIKKKIRSVLLKADGAIVRLPSIIGFLACHEAIKLGKPWAVEVVACPWDSLWNYGTLLSKIVAPMMMLINKYYIRRSNYALYVSKEFLQKRYPSRGVQINCSDVIIGKQPDEVLEKRLNRIEAGFKGRTINFGLIGSLDISYKGHETAFRALAYLKDTIPDFKLRLLGGGNRDRWDKLAKQLGIQDKVEFCGTLPSGVPVLEWLDNTDIYLIPSLQEGLPRALVEAMSRGCPSIGAITGGIPELLSIEFLHKKKDWKGLSEGILRLINDQECIRECAVRNFELSREYTKEILDKRRNGFWAGFVEYVRNK